MKRSTQFKVSVLGVLCFSVVPLAFALAAPRRARPISRGPMTQEVAIQVIKTSVATALSRPGVGPGTPGIPADFKQFVKVDCIGNVLHVEATTVIQNTQPDDGHVWSVRVVDPQDKTNVLFTRFFDFAGADRNAEQTSALNQVIDLPLDAGDYLVLVDFHRVPSDKGMDVFLDPKGFDIVNLSGGIRSITVGP